MRHKLVNYRKIKKKIGKIQKSTREVWVNAIHYKDFSKISNLFFKHKHKISQFL